MRYDSGGTAPHLLGKEGKEWEAVVKGGESIQRSEKEY
jgi:hypothetical protein